MKELIKRYSVSDGEGKPYLIRWLILGHHIKLHKFLKSDEDCMHDHPWAYISIILKGHYYEETPKGVKRYNCGSILFRPAKWIHRLSIDNTCWTLVINFKNIRQWGFWTKNGWIHWKEYISTGRCE